MKNKPRFKDFKHTCLKCHSVLNISVCLCHKKCVICDNPISKKLQRRMRKTLLKTFVRYSKIDEKRSKKSDKVVSKRILFVKLKEKLNKQYLEMFKDAKYCFFCNSFIENPKLKYIDHKKFRVFSEKYYICKDCVEQINKVKYKGD